MAHITNHETGEIEDIRTRFNFKRDTRDTAHRCYGPSKTQQHMRDETDINTIVRKFGVTKQLPTNIHMPMQGDFSDAMDYKSSLNLLIQAEREFGNLPANLRERFRNDPGELIAFLEQPGNRDEAVRLGLVKAPVEPPKAAIADTPASGAKDT